MNNLQNTRIIANMPEAEYHAHPAMSKGRLWAMNTSPMHFVHNWPHRQDKDTPSKFVGKVVHKAALEPDEFERVYFADIPPKFNMRKKDDKAAYAKWLQTVGGGRKHVKLDEFADATVMAYNVRTHPVLRDLLDNTRVQFELSIFWEDATTQIQCKARIDAWLPDYNIAIDLKTAASAEHGVFKNAAAKYGYYLQDAHYITGLQQVFKLESMAPMLFVVVENFPPYAVALYVLDDESRAFAERKRQRLMQRVEECSLAGKWPGYSTKIEKLSLPRWTLMQEVT